MSDEAQQQTLPLSVTWPEMPLAAFDLETTGPEPHDARIVTATIVRIKGGNVTSREWLVNPGVEISQGAIDVHGVTNEQAQAEGISPERAVPEILIELHDIWQEGCALAIFNANYDLTVMAAEAARLDLPMIDVGFVIDPFVVDRHLDRYRKGSRKLDAMCAHYDVSLNGAHNATEDALAAARLAWRLPRRYQELKVAPDVMMERQANWHRARMLNFAGYLRGKGEPTADIDLGWPLRTGETVPDPE